MHLSHAPIVIACSAVRCEPFEIEEKHVQRLDVAGPKMFDVGIRSEAHLLSEQLHDAAGIGQDHPSGEAVAQLHVPALTETNAVVSANRQRSVGMWPSSVVGFASMAGGWVTKSVGGGSRRRSTSQARRFGLDQFAHPLDRELGTGAPDEAEADHRIVSRAK
jgi:hypothetical protein